MEENPILKVQIIMLCHDFAFEAFPLPSGKRKTTRVSRGKNNLFAEGNDIPISNGGKDE